MDTLLYFDFYALKPTLFIKKQDFMRTYLGSFLSLITIIFIFIIFIFIIFCFINDTGLTVLYDKNYKNLNNIDLNLSKIIFFYRINSKNGESVDKRLLRTYPYLTIDTSTGTKYELLKEIKCDLDKLVKTNQQYKTLLNFDISGFNCVTFRNNSDAILSRRSSPFKNSYINLFVSKCQNNTNLNITDCFNENQINEFIENNSIYINLFLESVEIDHHNYSYPLNKKYYQNSLSISKDFIFSYTYFWRKIEYYTQNSLILFNYLFHNSSFFLDGSIKDKDIYSTNANFYVEKTIGRIQFLITVEYADSYVRKYRTLLDSFTILIAGFNLITELCRKLNFLLTKSFYYCSIIEPIITNSRPKTFKKNISIKNPIISNHLSMTPSLSCSKAKLNKNKSLRNNNPLLILNNQTTPLKYIPSFHNNLDDIFDPMKIDITNILTDIQTQKIREDIKFLDNIYFFFRKLFHSNNKKQMYLQRLEELLHEELSLDYLFKEFKRIKNFLNKDYQNFQTDNWNIISKNQFSINVSSIKHM